jgi:cytochrome c oxidase subunit III
VPDHVVVREPFHRPDQQHTAAMLGMYVFLATEVMLFGGLFAAIGLMRYEHAAAFVEASKRLHLWIGAANTLVLLTSSLTAALGVHAARQGRRGLTAGLLAATALLGLGFLGLKAYEYHSEYREGLLPVPGGDANLATSVERLFMNHYLVATGLHATHLVIGVGLVVVLAVRAGRHLRLPGRAVVIEIGVLYWHLVDLVWVFLYPALYLAR